MTTKERLFASMMAVVFEMVIQPPFLRNSREIVEQKVTRNTYNLFEIKKKIYIGQIY